jgi:DNA-directed RNA polymerase specialized sigma24 family protein
VDAVDTPLVPEYARWLDRLTATYEAVAYTCRVRLGDRATADAVAVRVAAGLIARPAVFRHWGLPYSGRIARLAEDAIADARAGRLGPSGSWPALRHALAEVPSEVQTTFVLTCVDGLADEEVATHCGCDPTTAGRRRAAALDHVRALAGEHGAVGAHDEER